MREGEVTGMREGVVREEWATCVREGVVGEEGKRELDIFLEKQTCPKNSLLALKVRHNGSGSFSRIYLIEL